MGSRAKLFLILWVAGIVGVLSFLLVDISALIALIPLPEGSPAVELPPPALLKLASVLQPAVLTSLAVLVGLLLAGRVGLHAPAAEALAEGIPAMPKLKPQIIPGVVAGILSGVAIVLTWVIAKPFFPAQFIARSQEFNSFIPAAVRMLYGGITEELLLRWGVMTLFVWVLWRLFQRDEAAPRGIYFVAGIIASAALFGIGHLPLASVLAGGLTIPIVIYVVVSNSIFGLVAGFLYWRRGLEAAMIAHMSAHLVLIAAIGLSF